MNGDCLAAAGASRARTMLSIDSNRAWRKRFSGIFLVSQAAQEFARGMVFGVTNDGHADSQQRCQIAFWYRIRRVVSAFCVHIRLKLAQQRVDVELVENYHGIN